MAISSVKSNEAITAEQLLEAAKRVGELAEKEAHEAETNATISQNVVNLIKRNTTYKNFVTKGIWWSTN